MNHFHQLVATCFGLFRDDRPDGTRPVPSLKKNRSELDRHQQRQLLVHLGRQVPDERFGRLGSAVASAGVMAETRE